MGMGLTRTIQRPKFDPESPPPIPQVRTAVDSISNFEGDGALSMLACDACAARIFPETSVDTSGKIRFKFGDDGPVMAMEVALDIPKIGMDFQPSGEAFSFPKEGGKGNGCPGSISVDVEGFELTYKRTANRLGGLESSLRSITISDPDPGTAFHRPLAPGLYEELVRGNFQNVCFFAHKMKFQSNGSYAIIFIQLLSILYSI